MTAHIEPVAERASEAPHDGYFANQIRTNFRNLTRMVGFDRARETVAGIVNSEAERKSP